MDHHHLQIQRLVGANRKLEIKAPSIIGNDSYSDAMEELLSESLICVQLNTNGSIN